MITGAVWRCLCIVHVCVHNSLLKSYNANSLEKLYLFFFPPLLTDCQQGKFPTLLPFNILQLQQSLNIFGFRKQRDYSNPLLLLNNILGSMQSFLMCSQQWKKKMEIHDYCICCWHTDSGQAVFLESHAKLRELEVHYSPLKWWISRSHLALYSLRRLTKKGWEDYLGSM